MRNCENCCVLLPEPLTAVDRHIAPNFLKRIVFYFRLPTQKRALTRQQRFRNFRLLGEKQRPGRSTAASARPSTKTDCSAGGAMQTSQGGTHSIYINSSCFTKRTQNNLPQRFDTHLKGADAPHRDIERTYVSRVLCNPT